ncbi:MAG: tetratricopeptide repeat-containing sensor histidine kinase [Bacteroidetes bacterium]|nr:tetratricopeptide repeat-containing sensor histidine kinase [Bacteroidota bacterium]
MKRPIKANNLLWILFIVFFLSGGMRLFASENDSLRRLITASISRIDRLNARLLYSRKIIPEQLDTARMLLLQAEELKNSSDLLLRADYFNVWGLYYWYRNEADSAITELTKTAQMPVQERLFQKLAEAYNNLGVLYSRGSRTDSSLKYLHKALELDQTRDNPKGIAKTSYDLGRIYRSQSKYLIAYEYQIKAVELMRQQKDTIRTMSTLVALGVLSSDLRKVDEAITYYKEVEQLADAYSGNYNKAVLYNNITAYYMDVMNDFEKAEYYARKGLEEATNDLQSQTFLYANLASALRNLGQLDSATYYFRRAISQAIAYGYDQSLLGSYSNYGNMFKANGNIDSAGFYLNKALNVSEQLGSRNWKQMILAGLASLDSLKGDYQSAYKHLLQSAVLKDSIFNEESDRRIEELKVIYGIKEKDAELEAMDAKNKLNKEIIRKQYQLIYISAIAVLLFLGIILVLRRSRLKILEKNKEIRSQKDAIQQQNKNLQELNQTKDKFISIISHDLRGPFNSLIGLLEMFIDDYNTIDDEERLNMLKSMHKSSTNTYNLLVNLLDWSRAQRNKIENNPKIFNCHEVVNQVFELLASRAERKSHDLINDLPENTEAFTDPNLISSILINLVNNAIKFTPKGGTIRVHHSEEVNQHMICVDDNGIGIPIEKQQELFRIDSDFHNPGTEKETGTGLGLVLVKEFVDLIGGEIRVSGLPEKGMRFCFTIPKKG